MPASEGRRAVWLHRVALLMSSQDSSRVDGAQSRVMRQEQSKPGFVPSGQVGSVHCRQEEFLGSSVSNGGPRFEALEPTYLNEDRNARSDGQTAFELRTNPQSGRVMIWSHQCRARLGTPWVWYCGWW